jgi:ankyrin
VTLKELVLATLFGMLALTVPTVTAAEDVPALVMAADTGDIAAVRQLLNNHTDPNTSDSKGLTALNWAAYSGRLDVAQELIAHGAKVDSNTNKDKWTPLINAAAQGHPDIVAFLLDHGANISATSATYCQPLAFAVENDHTAVAELLLRRGATIDAYCDHQTALEIAAAHAYAGTARLLLGKGAEGGNALFGLARDGNIKGAQVLLDLGVNVDRPVRLPGSHHDGWTALLGAVIVEQWDMVRLLLARGANVNAADPQTGNTVLIEAVKKCRDELVSELLAHGALAGTRNVNGDTALDYASDDENPLGGGCSEEMRSQLSKAQR